MAISQKVLACFERCNARAAAMLSLVDTSALNFCLTEKGETNCWDGRTARYVHAPSGALQEAASWISLRNIELVDVLVVYGIGLGWLWKALQPWLAKNRQRRLIFVEDDLAVVSMFLEGALAEDFFNDPQSTLLFFEPGEEGENILEVISWNLYDRAWSCLASPAYDRFRRPAFEHLVQRLVVQQADVTDVLKEFLSFGDSPLRNFIRNMFLWRRSKNGGDLCNQFRDCPAVVVAAGPSLDQELATLRELRSKALILAGGSAVGALIQAGIMPHLAATVDPNCMQYIRLRQMQPFALPLLYRSRALYEGLMFYKGPLIYLRGGDGYPLVEWFEHALGAFGPIMDGGHSVSNMLIEVAHFLGCRPIIMVGYDLAYTDGKRYSSFLSESLAHGESDRFSAPAQGEPVWGAGYEGQRVNTEAKWKTEAEWIENFHQKHPRLQLINTDRKSVV